MRLALRGGDHSHKSGAFFRFSAGNAIVPVNVLLLKDHIVRFRVCFQRLELGVGGKLRLILRRYADVGGGQQHFGHMIGSFR